MPAVSTIMLKLLHPLSTSSITARHLLDFMEQGNITEADAPTIYLGGHPIQTIGAPPSSSHVLPNALSAATLSIYPGLEQAPNNAGLHTQWLSKICNRRRVQKK